MCPPRAETGDKTMIRVMDIGDHLPTGQTGFELDETARNQVRFVYRLNREIGHPRQVAAAKAAAVAAERDLFTITETRSCEWFALCDNPATTTVAHPILGDVPTCERCAALAAGVNA